MTNKLFDMDGYDFLSESSYSTLLPSQREQTKIILEKIFPRDIKSIIDATAHIGGDTIHFSKIFPFSKIIAIDNNMEAIRCLKNNVYRLVDDPYRVTIFHINFVEWLNNINDNIHVDFCYLDPPWLSQGQRDYLDINNMKLYLDNKPIEDIIKIIFNKNITNKILLKIPKNFDLDNFKKELNNYKIKKYNLYKKKGTILSHCFLYVKK